MVIPITPQDREEGALMCLGKRDIGFRFEPIRKFDVPVQQKQEHIQLEAEYWYET